MPGDVCNPTRLEITLPLHGRKEFLSGLATSIKTWYNAICSFDGKQAFQFLFFLFFIPQNLTLSDPFPVFASISSYWCVHARGISIFEIHDSIHPPLARFLIPLEYVYPGTTMVFVAYSVADDFLLWVNREPNPLFPEPSLVNQMQFVRSRPEKKKLRNGAKRFSAWSGSPYAIWTPQSYSI